MHALTAVVMLRVLLQQARTHAQAGVPGAQVSAPQAPVLHRQLVSLLPAVRLRMARLLDQTVLHVAQLQPSHGPPRAGGRP